MPLQNSNILSEHVETGERLNRQNVVLLMNEDFHTRTIQIFRLANIGRLNLHKKLVTKCETVAKVLDKWVAKLWSNSHVKYRNF